MIDAELTERKRLMRWSGWFCLINFLIITGMLARFLKYANETEGLLQSFYLVSALSGHACSLVMVVFLAVLLLPVLLLPRQFLVKPLGIVAATIGIVILQIDFAVYCQYRFHINGMVIDLLVNGGSDIFEFSRSTWIVGLLTIAGVVVVEVLISKAAWALAVRTFRVKIKGILAVLGFLMILSSNLIHAFADATYFRPITAMTRHLPLYHPVTAKTFLESHGFVDLNENWKLNRLASEKNVSNTINYPLTPLTFKDVKPLMNIVFIVVDSWRYDALNETVTPHVFKFLNDENAMTFDNHISGGNATRSGIFSLFYGMFGTFWTCMETEQIGSVFIDTLIDKEYQMGVFASARLTEPAFNQTVFRSMPDLRLFSDGDNAWERDLDMVSDWEEWLTNRSEKKPFFTVLFFDAAHSITFPPDYKQRFEPMVKSVDYHKLKNDYDPVPLVNRYKTSLHFIDSQIGNVLERLKAEDCLKDTVILLTSDHGQEFNDNKNNYWGHSSNYTKYQLQVPLVIHWPGRMGKNYAHLTSHIDVVPTMMREVLGCTNPASDFSNGKSLFDTSERRWLCSGGGLSDHAIIEKERITALFNTGGYEIYTPEYNVMKGAKLNPEIVKETISETSRFNK
ncbi:MAG: DUF3413 domain-containing protein [Proteobacteria bacterium]|nr:DUF3413 domain-containing protein [Pseudomonadota bacterium]